MIKFHEKRAKSVMPSLRFFERLIKKR